MQVLHAIPSYLPIIGGAELNAYHLIRSLRPLGIESSLLTYNMTKRWKPVFTENDCYEDSFRIIRCGGVRLYPDIKYIRALVPCLFGVHILPITPVVPHFKSADLIHLHDEVDLSLPLTAMRVSVPKILHIRSLAFLYAWFRRSPFRRLILLRSADAFICNSKKSEEYLTKLGMTPNRIRVIPNGVDLKTFCPSDAIKRESRRLVFAGRMQKDKGLHVLLDSVRQIKKPIELAIAVAGVTDRAYFEQVRQLAESIQRETEHTIGWHTALPQSELADLYRSATLLICPSFDEPFGNIVIEAMACGTPAVATRAGGPLDIITDGSDGVFFEREDDKELTGVIESLLDSPNALRQMSKNARDKTVKLFGWDKVARDVREVYNHLR